MTASSRAQSFDTAAAQYAASRPSYPAALFDSIEEFAARRLAAARVAGAFTGQRGFFTRDQNGAILGCDLVGRMFTRVPAPPAP